MVREVPDVPAVAVAATVCVEAALADAAQGDELCDGSSLIGVPSFAVTCLSPERPLTAHGLSTAARSTRRNAAASS